MKKNVNKAFYGYAVFKGAAGVPLHVVEIKCPLLAAFHVFNTAADAGNYIHHERAVMDTFGYDLIYNPEHEFAPCLLDMYRRADVGLCSAIDDRQLYICA